MGKDESAEGWWKIWEEGQLVRLSVDDWMEHCDEG